MREQADELKVWMEIARAEEAVGRYEGPWTRKRGKVGAGHLQQYRQLLAEASNVKRWNGSGLGRG